MTATAGVKLHRPEPPPATAPYTVERLMPEAAMWMAAASEVGGMG